MSYTPVGTNTLSSYIVIDDTHAAMDFSTKAFGTKERLRNQIPGSDTNMHAEFTTAGQTVVLNQENSDCRMLSPKFLGNSPDSLHVKEPDVDAAFAAAREADTAVQYPVMDMF